MSLLTLLVSSIALAGCTRQAPDAAAADYREAIEIARTEIWQDINTGKASSATVAIMDNGKIVYAEGFGMADRENSISVDTETVFNMGSVSKTFCSVAVMLLVDDGKVKLDDPVMNYVTDFTMADPRYKDITVRMLLNHTSGIPGTTWANTFGYSSNPTVYEDTLNNLSRSNLKHAPGAAAPYCNDGFTLAEILVTRVSGQTFIDFLSQRIFKPLSLNHTGLSVGEVKDHVAARYYNPENGAAVPLEVLSILGAGGLSTTASDLVKFADSFSEKGKQILSPASIAEMIKASPSPFAVKAMQETGINPEMDYGLGLDVAGLPVYQQKDIYVIEKAAIPMITIRCFSLTRSAAFRWRYSKPDTVPAL
jgi:CubicO group peptidase (beta-lactamase class C family)